MADDSRELQAPTNGAQHPSSDERDWCLDCGTDLSSAPAYSRYRVCPGCRFHYYLPAIQRIDLLADAGTFKETNQSLVPLDPLAFADQVPYRERLARAQRVTGLLEAVVTGTCYIGGMPAVMAALEFGFMGGSIGSAVGEKIALAAETALQRRLPFVLVVCGGGPRMQEGVLSLMQMAKMVSAINRFSRRGVPFISILASPSTGHLYASAASMADIIFAEPGALIGFAPLRAAQEATGHPLPKDFQTAEFHLEHGMVDRIVDRADLKRELALVLDLLGVRYRLILAGRNRSRQVERPPAPAWERVQLARHEERPTARDYIDRIIFNFVELHGDRLYGDDPAVVCGMGYLAGEAVMLVGQERGRGPEAAHCREGRGYPEGFRKAQRAMRLAAKFKMPVVTFVDTPGAYTGLEAEQRGIGGAIASTISLMSELPTPVLSAIIGEGGSEGALAFSVADRLLMMENAIYTPISPEAAASILYRDPERADEMASALKLTAHDCRALGIVDAVVPEPEGGAHMNFDEAARQVERLLVQALLDVQVTFQRSLLRNRMQKFRRMGSYATYFQATLASEAVQFQEMLLRGLRDVRDRLQGKSQPAQEQKPPGEARRAPGRPG